MKILFWNTDTQRDFINPDGKLTIPGAEEIKPLLKEITEYARDKGIKVVNTADCHTYKSEELSDKPDYKNTFPPHCMLLEDGIEFIEETYPKTKEDNYCMVCYTDEEIHHSFDRARNIIIYKDKFDVFSNALTDDVLTMLDPDLVVVYGVATNICVDFAVKGLLSRGYNVSVVADAIKELPGCSLVEVFEKWAHLGGSIMPWELIREELKG